MDYSALYAARKAAGLVGALILCLALALAVDGMIAGGRKNPNAFDLLPGQSIALSDTMPRGAEKLNDIVPAPSDPRLGVSLTETFSGFWLGGTLWRARLSLPADMPLGDYTLTMRYQNGTEAVPRQAFSIRVLKDAAAVQAASLSLTTRLVGLSPYGLAALLLPLALLPMGASYLLSRKIAQALRARNMAEIYRAMASPEGQRIFFPQPAMGAPEPESAIEVLDERGRTVLGNARVVAAAKGDVEAVMQDGAHIRPGSLARPV